MKIELHEITIAEIANGYIDNAEEGVIGYGGKLNIRPKYQREFVYDENKRNLVIDSILKKFPLNVMYWVVNNESGFEILDGQQRTVSFCRYVMSDYPVMIDGHPMFFNNLAQIDKEKILNYNLLVYFCTGNDKEIIDWFKIINIAGEKLTEQELRNAVYTGTWLTSAKSSFSKSGCGAYLLAKDYVNGSPIRQEILETALSWISKGDMEKYMSVHQHDHNANELWTYFKNVIDWVRITFTVYRKEMKGINWSGLYDVFKDKMFDTQKLEKEVQALMIDDDVTNKKGIYAYVLTKEEKYLNIRTFSENMKREAYERQKGNCKNCGKHFEYEDMEGDHIDTWRGGGKTNAANCQMLCKPCNRRKSGK